MRYLILSLIFLFSGCATGQMPGYISRADHPYDKKFYTGFEKIVSTMIYVLREKGWTIESEADPETYERDDRYENNGYQNLLIITDIRKHFLHMSGAHLNVFIHSSGNTSDVEVRYEAQSSLVMKFTSLRNDEAIQGILDAVEQEVER